MEVSIGSPVSTDKGMFVSSLPYPLLWTINGTSFLEIGPNQTTFSFLLEVLAVQLLSTSLWHTLCSYLLSHIGQRLPGYSLEAAEDRKFSKHEKSCEEQGVTLLGPLWLSKHSKLSLFSLTREIVVPLREPHEGKRPYDRQSSHTLLWKFIVSSFFLYVPSSGAPFSPSFLLFFLLPAGFFFFWVWCLINNREDKFWVF